MITEMKSVGVGIRLHGVDGHFLCWVSQEAAFQVLSVIRALDGKGTDALAQRHTNPVTEMKLVGVGIRL